MFVIRVFHSYLDVCVINQRCFGHRTGSEMKLKKTISEIYVEGFWIRNTESRNMRKYHSIHHWPFFNIKNNGGWWPDMLTLHRKCYPGRCSCNPIRTLHEDILAKTCFSVISHNPECNIAAEHLPQSAALFMCFSCLQKPINLLNVCGAVKERYKTTPWHCDMTSSVI